MIKEKLVESASKIPGFNHQLAQEYASKRESMVAKINELMLAREDIEDLIGEHNNAMMCDNHDNHARIIESLIMEFDAGVLVDTVEWVFATYPKHHFSHLYWPAQLNTWVNVLQTELSLESFDQIYPLYNWFIVNQPQFINLVENN